MNTALLIVSIIIQYERASVCAEDTTNHPITIEMRDDATLKELVQYIMNYQDGDYRAIPNSGGNIWWQLSYDKGTLAYICDNHRDTEYANVSSETQLKDIPITHIYAHIAELPK